MLYKKTLSKIRAATRKMKKLPGKVRRFSYIASHGIGNAPLPEMIALPLTAQCNYRCSFCEIVGVTRMLKDEQRTYFPNTLTVEHVRIFRGFIKQARKVNFGGMTGLGEPLLSPYFQEIIWDTRRSNPTTRISLSSNARLLTPALTDSLLKAAPLRLTFSIHAASEGAYKKVMGAGYTAVMENLRYFCHQAQSFQNIKTTINFGLGKWNHTDAEAIVLLAKELGINTVFMYPYYKSPNAFMEDVSLYSSPEIANSALDAAYRTAQKIGQRMAPPHPHYLGQEENPSRVAQVYQGGCQIPFTHFLLQSVPFDKNKVACCVCNRIVPFLIDLDQDVRHADLLWMWNHPVLKALRFPHTHIPEICLFCKDPGTPRLRSLHHDEYKIRRDRVVQEHLSRFQEFPVSPNRSITLLSENIFSIK